MTAEEFKRRYENPRLDLENLKYRPIVLCVSDCNKCLAQGNDLCPIYKENQEGEQE